MALTIGNMANLSTSYVPTGRDRPKPSSMGLGKEGG
jgi:hypothetical protein